MNPYREGPKAVKEPESESLKKMRIEGRYVCLALFIVSASLSYMCKQGCDPNSMNYDRGHSDGVRSCK